MVVVAAMRVLVTASTATVALVVLYYVIQYCRIYRLCYHYKNRGGSSIIVLYWIRHCSCSDNRANILFYIIRGVVALWTTNGTHYIHVQKSPPRVCASNSPCTQKQVTLCKCLDLDSDVTH